MITYIFKRLIESIPLVFIIITLTFFMVRLAPGDPFSNEKMTEEQAERLRIHYGLDKPLIEQYWQYLSGLLKGDMGPTIKHPGWNVQEIILDRIPISLELGFWGLCVALCIGIGAGVIAAMRPNSYSDYIPMAIAMAGICLPTFVLGPILALVFGLELGWLNVWGWVLPQDRILPALTLGLFYSGYIARLTRGSLAEVGHLDFIRTAYAKGLSMRRIYFAHSLRNALSPVVSFLGPAAAGLISGSFVVETIFQIPGLGQMFVESAINAEYSLILGLVIFYAILVISFNLLVDILLVAIDPRQRLEK